jgi:hypothetical protein
MEPCFGDDTAPAIGGMLGAGRVPARAEVNRYPTHFQQRQALHLNTADESSVRWPRLSRSGHRQCDVSAPVSNRESTPDSGRSRTMAPAQEFALTAI